MPGPETAEGCEGVTVAVALPGELVVRCAHGADARQALDSTGLAVHAGRGEGPYGDRAYVCRINNFPTAADDDCAGHEDGAPYWKVWRVGLAPVAWRTSQTGDGPAGVAVCPGSLVGFSFGGEMPVGPEQVITTPGWLPPRC
ncbi:hypothetical protein A4R43_38690 [Amycolatopsis albispora]|uniref:Uncharacterized protein n=2 Tax=Amycolatopsis albispora TaxID=1804986 RepID=A0A344LHY6_9PSEU|nr:hypothetical protein A4R43_38690 [Amycolatopsis albispora]